MSDKKEAKVTATEIKKVTTTIDGGARVTIDLGYQDMDLIKMLLEKSMMPNNVLYVAFVNKDLNHV